MQLISRLRFFVVYVFFKVNFFVFGKDISFLGLPKLSYDTRFVRGRRVTVGYRFFCGRNCHIAAPAQIGDDVMFAGDVALVGGDHKFDEVSVPMNAAGRDVMKDIIIEDDVWVGFRAVILHGVHIGKGAVIAAGSIVTKNVDSYSIVAGNPAKHIRYRKMP
ncbi:galactoside O-acetyltransferase [Alcanivorax xiamenensis]|uniref:Galactoside O-acetyltransferase n=1 Tax=Alcanivorax xiamenensis TaxID=1177156 RepID=A0ABQ6Y4E7_9GAMM|nr:acyltransferase [Alcanivorax xiamenensis]KAF0803378.1 galactoside O-acetyltransferase [Alcanivorax xiamenensis]